MGHPILRRVEVWASRQSDFSLTFKAILPQSGFPIEELNMGTDTDDEDSGNPPPKELDDKNKGLLKYLREENEKNRLALRKEAEATRKFFVDSMKLVSYPLTALVVIAGFLGWNNISNFRDDLKSQAEGEIKRLVPTEVGRQVPIEVAREVPSVVGREVPIEVMRVVPGAVDTEVRSVVPHSANEEVKRVLPPAIGHAIIQTVADTKSETEAAIREKVTDSLRSQNVQETISNAINNSDVLKNSIASQIEAKELQAREATEAAEEAARASAQYEPRIQGVSTGDKFELDADPKDPPCKRWPARCAKRNVLFSDQAFERKR